jgi:hypothetical protein
MTLRKYYIAQAYRKVANAGSKPSMDFETVLKRRGYKNLGLPSISTNSPTLWWIWNWLSARLAILRMPKRSVIALQYPDQRHLSDIYTRIQQLGNKSVILIHDINELRGWETWYPDILKTANVMIAHTRNMCEWIKHKFNRNNIVELGIFDYLQDESSVSEYKKEDTVYTIVFAGRLGKADFLNELELSVAMFSLKLFGNGITDNVRQKDFVDYKGVCLPDELPSKIRKFDFGLVWDGDSVNECTGQMGEYLKYNCPYKLSSYIASGLPVIIWDKMGMAPFVKKYNIGITVSSLLDLSATLSKISTENYAIMRRNAEYMQERLHKGEFYEYALLKAELMIGL